MEVSVVEAREGDLVVVARSAMALDGRLDLQAPRRYAVIEWGSFQLLSDSLSALSKDDALMSARHCADERGRQAWDGSGKEIRRLPHLPLVYRELGESYSVSLDVTDYAQTPQALQWQSVSNLSAAEALARLQKDGVSSPVAHALIGKAPMPSACT